MFLTLSYCDKALKNRMTEWQCRLSDIYMDYVTGKPRSITFIYALILLLNPPAMG